MQLIRRVLVGGIIVLLAGGCVPPRDQEISSRILPGGKACESKTYEDSSCAFGVYGFEIGSDLPALNHPNIEKVSFDKTLNTSELERVLKTSAKNTVRSMTNAGVEVSQNGERCGCAIFKTLPVTEPHLMAYWEKVAQRFARDEEDAWLLGLFVPAELMNVIGAPFNKPAIILRGDTDRWTLVHEFAHFLFDQERVKNGQSSVRIDKNNDKAINDMNRLWSWVENKNTNVLSVDERNSIVKRFVENSKFIKSYLLAFPLEELSIEALLSMYHRRGDFKNVPANARGTAGRYICKKYLDVKELVGSISKISDGLIKKISLQGPDLESVKETEDSLKDLVTEAASLNKSYGLGEACMSKKLLTILKPLHPHDHDDSPSLNLDSSF